MQNLATESFSDITIRKLGQKITKRIMLFLLIGAMSSILQFALLWYFTHTTGNKLVSSTLAVELSVLFNFTSNRFVTWSNRFDGQSRWQSMKGFIPLFVLFNVLTPSICLKLVGIPMVSTALDINPMPIAVFLEGVGVIINYMMADKLFFGRLRRL